MSTRTLCRDIIQKKGLIMSDMYDEGFKDGERAARRELKPLAEAIADAVLMFQDIERARALPPTAQALQQYVAMGKQLQRLLQLSGLLSV